MIEYDNETALSESFARILMVGAPKIGKTTALLKGLPKPYLINCDGKDSARYAAVCGAKFRACNVSTEAEWQQATKHVVKLASAGEINSVIVDTVTLLADSLVRDFVARGKSGYDIWTALSENIVDQYVYLRENLNAHLFVTAHLSHAADEGDVVGILPLIPGRSAKILAGMVADWICFECEASSGARNYLLGNQKNWTASGRNIKRSCVIKADGPDGGVPELFAELGIAL